MVNKKEALQEQKKPENEANGRRRFVKGALAASPVIMTLSSQSALGAEICTVSGMMSGNLSDARIKDYCAGLSPGAWKNEANGSTSGYATEFDTVTFQEIFGANWHGNGPSGNWSNYGAGSPTLKEVLNFLGNEDKYQFGAHAVAAYANAVYLYPDSYKMTPDEVKIMIRDVIVSGVYTDPSSGRSLDAQQMVSFITATFH